MLLLLSNAVVFIIDIAVIDVALHSTGVLQCALHVELALNGFTKDIIETASDCNLSVMEPIERNDYVLFHKLYKGKCAWCGEPDSGNTPLEVWNKNPDFIMQKEDVKKVYQDDLHGGVSAKILIRCHEYAVLEVSCA